MARPKRKAIYFDLDTNKMKNLGIYPDGYRLLENEFKKHSFTRRQGSGYISENKLTEGDIYETVIQITENQPWLADCVKKIDVTDIGRQHDLTAIVKEFAAVQREDPLSVRQAGEYIDIEPQRVFGETEREYILKRYDERTNQSTKMYIPKEQAKLQIENGMDKFIVAMERGEAARNNLIRSNTQQRGRTK